MTRLTRHATPHGPRWARDGRLLPAAVTLAGLLTLRAPTLRALLAELPTDGEVDPAWPLLAPVEPEHEVWACGVTYLRSRDARQEESRDADVYARVYEAERPEIFFKATGRRVVGHGGEIRVRRDSRWNVPEPEAVLVLNRDLEIVGYTAGNDVSSRDIEGENPLYLPQAKSYDGACALGPALILRPGEPLGELAIRLRIERSGEVLYDEATSTAQMKRRFEELAGYLGRELAFPGGALLMTGTSLVPGDDFDLQPGDRVAVGVAELELINTVAAR